jgi:hypothetical protein
VRRFDFGRSAFVFRDGEVVRAYPALEGAGAWRWLVEVSVSREMQVALEIRATSAWPVESVTLAPQRLP